MSNRVRSGWTKIDERGILFSNTNDSGMPHAGLPASPQSMKMVISQMRRPPTAALGCLPIPPRSGD